MAICCVLFVGTGGLFSSTENVVENTKLVSFLKKVFFLLKKKEIVFITMKNSLKL